MPTTPSLRGANGAIDSPYRAAGHCVDHSASFNPVEAEEATTVPVASSTKTVLMNGITGHFCYHFISPLFTFAPISSAGPEGAFGYAACMALISA